MDVPVIDKGNQFLQFAWHKEDAHDDALRLLHLSGEQRKNRLSEDSQDTIKVMEDFFIGRQGNSDIGVNSNFHACSCYGSFSRVKQKERRESRQNLVPELPCFDTREKTKDGPCDTTSLVNP